METELATGRRLREAEGLGLLANAGLAAEAARRPVAGYSKGMRQKVGIAVAAAKGAEALLFDEPTSGLDPLAANEFARHIAELAGRGLSVLMVIHDLFLAGRCGPRVGIMQRGRLVTTLEAAGVDHLDLGRAYRAAGGGRGAA
ncbi:MAG: ATP-binding cassette domain-containing protein [Isosphaeraceae bacterium]|nr:ATP-binding cassette domain-containing protein [Isosphaeraceae bacterium]